MSTARLSKAETLMWLNDRLGQPAHLSVMLGPEAAFRAADAKLLTYAAGALEHWRDAVPQEVWPEGEREDNSAFYKVGTGGIDLVAVAGAFARTVEDSNVDMLYIPLGTNVGLYIAIAQHQEGDR